jgi:ATP-dependent helicase HrpB
VTLPIHAVLPDLLATLGVGPNAVLVAPPGAGKTTAVAPALLDQPWCTGQILLLSPRRLAARAAAERIADQLNTPIGSLVGYATRMESRHAASTRILVLTEGIFRNRIQADPELAGVSAVLFDEVHERSLDSDFGLALALDAQAGLRPDLRLVAMSATLDGARFARLLSAPVIESQGRIYPLELRHIGRRAEARIEDEMAAAIRRALAEEEGGILAFLPGVGEIERTAERLEGIPAQLHRLHGSLDPADQQATLRKSGNRKVILATAIAETSLTIDGVRIIVDSGLARRARYDRAAGVARLVTERVSQAAATQRAGRAARQQPGIAYRLWEEAATAGLPPYDPPEILEADLSPLLLDCALWGVTDPMQLAWLDPPPAAALAEARARLTALGALDGNGRPTAHGRAVAGLPLPPRLAHMLLTAAASGAAFLAAEAAMLLSERGLGGQDADLDARLTRWRRERGPRAEAARRLAQRLEKMATASSQAGPERDLDLAAIIALGFPDRLAKRRDARGENWISVGGRGFRLDPNSPLARADWLAVADIQGAASGARIMSAVPIDRAQVDALFADQIESGTRLSFDPATGGVRAESGRHLGAITLAKGQDSTASPEAIAQALLEAVRTHGLTILPWPPSVDRLRTRAHWAGLDAVTDTALLASLDLWLAPLLTGKRRLSDIDEGAWGNALRGLMGWDGQQMLDRLAPANFTSPAGTTHPIDYAADGGPMVELRVQALFGVSDHPVIGPDRVPLILSLTSPAGRPIQTTRDLPGFWAGSWRDVAKEMRGAYPKHNWPDDPASATASLKTKKAQARH